MVTASRIAVVGAGSWGTAIAKLLADQGHPTVLWAHEPEVAHAVQTKQRNPLFLREAELPESLAATNHLDEALDAADVVVSVVPTQHIRAVYTGAATALAEADVVVTASKGIEVDTLRLPHEILADSGAHEGRIVALSGPSFAHEVAAGLPTAVVAAGTDRETAVRVRDLFSTDRFRVYSTTDVIGVELGGALKNVIAIAAGVADGLGLGHNTRAALITRGLAEITRLGVARGGHPRTFAGLSGLGDLLLTCTGGQSRNHAVGEAVGRGRTWSAVSAEMTEVAEGVHTSRSARELGQASDVEMPITEQVYEMLFDDKDPAAAVGALTGRDLRDEHEGP